MTDEREPKKNKSKLDRDLFDNLEQLRIDKNFTEAVGVKKQILTVPVRKPFRQDFIHVHPEESYHFPTVILEIKEDNESYIVVPSLWSELPNEVIPKMLYTTINRQGVLFLWPVRMEDETGRLDDWNRSAHKAAQLAMKNWVRVASNRSLPGYETFTPTGNIPEPKWPGITFKEILKIAFQDKIIDNRDHVVLKRLRGEI